MTAPRPPKRRPGVRCWSSVTIGQLTPDAALFDWRVVNCFEVILHANAFDRLRSRCVRRSCCDIATKTTAVDKRCDLPDLRLMIAHGVARTVSAGGAGRTHPESYGLDPTAGLCACRWRVGLSAGRISSRGPSGRQVCSRTPFVMSPDAEARRRFAANFASRVVVNSGCAGGLVSSPTVANCRWDPRRCKSRLARWHL
jgi:hypothetical protein